MDKKHNWKSRNKYCKSCKHVTRHAYSNCSKKGNITKIFICRVCEYTTITHSINNEVKRRKLLLNEENIL